MKDHSDEVVNKEEGVGDEVSLYDTSLDSTNFSYSYGLLIELKESKELKDSKEKISRLIIIIRL